MTATHNKHFMYNVHIRELRDRTLHLSLICYCTLTLA